MVGILAGQHVDVEGHLRRRGEAPEEVDDVLARELAEARAAPRPSSARQ